MLSQDDGDDGDDGPVRRGVLRPDTGVSGMTGDPRARPGSGVLSTLGVQDQPRPADRSRPLIRTFANQLKSLRSTVVGVFTPWTSASGLSGSRVTAYTHTPLL